MLNRERWLNCIAQHGISTGFGCVCECAHAQIWTQCITIYDKLRMEDIAAAAAAVVVGVVNRTK